MPEKSERESNHTDVKSLFCMMFKIILIRGPLFVVRKIKFLRSMYQDKKVTRMMLPT
jgi:hypothetical protein